MKILPTCKVIVDCSQCTYSKGNLCDAASDPDKPDMARPLYNVPTIPGWCPLADVDTDVYRVDDTLKCCWNCNNMIVDNDLDGLNMLCWKDEDDRKEVEPTGICREFELFIEDNLSIGELPKTQVSDHKVVWNKQEGNINATGGGGGSS